MSAGGSLENADDGEQDAPVVVASYESECSECGFEIEPGDEIRADGAGGWMHAAPGDVGGCP